MSEELLNLLFVIILENLKRKITLLFNRNSFLSDVKTYTNSFYFIQNYFKSNHAAKNLRLEL